MAKTNVYENISNKYFMNIFLLLQLFIVLVRCKELSDKTLDRRTKSSEMEECASRSLFFVVIVKASTLKCKHRYNILLCAIRYGETKNRHSENVIKKKQKILNSEEKDTRIFDDKSRFTIL